MATTMTIADKQFLAKILYTREQLDGKVVAKRVGVSANTMSKWVNSFGWDSLRKRLLVSKDIILSDLYEEMEELSNTIKAREKGKRFSNNAEADIKVKLTASIRALETELAIADLVASGIQFIKHLQTTVPLKQVIEISELWNSFLQVSIKK